MSASDTQAALSVSLLAAFADGSKQERERAESRRIAEGPSSDDAVRPPALPQDVLVKHGMLATVLPALLSEESRHLAYEMAVCVCDADVPQSGAEQAFLGELRQVLRLEGLSADGFAQQAEAMAAAPLAAGTRARGSVRRDERCGPSWGAGPDAKLRPGSAARTRASGAGHTARQLRGEQRAPPLGAGELGQAAQARL